MHNSGYASVEDFPGLLVRQIGPFLFGFGNKDVTTEMLAKRFSKLSWSQVKQVHSAKIVESEEASVEADAHYTTRPNHALIIKSADCVPILIACPSSEKPKAVCAIHAGWRGVTTEIVQNSVRALLEKGYAPTLMHAAVGPHIQMSSFEVGLDVALELKRAAMRAGIDDISKIIIPHELDAAKRRVDLAAIVHAQLKFFQIREAGIDHVGGLDTLTNSEWSSFRRDGAKAGRNLSFIAVSD